MREALIQGLAVWRAEWARLIPQKRRKKLQDQRNYLVCPGEPPSFASLNELRRVMGAAAPTDAALRKLGATVPQPKSTGYDRVLTRFHIWIADEGGTLSARKDDSWRPPKFFLLPEGWDGASPAAMPRETARGAEGGDPARHNPDRADVITAMNRLDAGEVAERAGTPLGWYVFHPDTQIPYPLKSVWALANDTHARAFKTNEARTGLERLDFECIDLRTQANLTPDELAAAETPAFEEGAERHAIRTDRTRSKQARERCKALYRALDIDHRLRCLACRIDFGQAYGAHGEGFIHIHHLDALAEAQGARQVRPEIDLVPLCPNCHAMVHRKPSQMLTISDLVAIIAPGTTKR